MHKKQTVLIVDDEPTNIKILSKIVEPYATVFFALSGEAALSLVASKQPDLILLDIVMPGIDGYDLIKKLKKDPLSEHIPVIFVTEKREENEEIKGLKLGAIDYITKPLSAPIVQARIKNHLELKRTRDLLENLSSSDGLTGIPNRRAFDDNLENEWNKALRLGMSISLIMIDIDHFKLYNDHFGHIAGDEILIQIAELIHQTAARASDFAARYGGEEFAVILPGLKLDKAYLFAKKLQAKVLEQQTLRMEDSGSPGQVTLSYGVASQVPAYGMNAVGLVQSADEMLFRAKQKGRDCIEPDLSGLFVTQPVDSDNL